MTTRRKAMKRMLALAAAASGGVAFAGARRGNAYYAGPVSDHFDGEHFFSPGRRAPKRVQTLWRLYARETWSKWPAEFPSPFRDAPPPRVEGSRLRLSFIGHASWLIQTAGRNILVDPQWSDRAGPYNRFGPRRANPPGLAFDALPRIDAVLVTHNHYDHLDIATLARLWQRDRPLIVTPLGNDTIMRDGIPGIEATAIDWHQTANLPGGILAHAEPSEHWSARGVLDRRHALWASFVVATPHRKVYAIGDTGFGDGRTFVRVRERHPAIDVALLPIGAYEPRWFMRDQHMNPQEAVRALQLCGAHMALGHHWGTFQLTTEPHDQPPKDLAAALAALGIPPERFPAMRPGQVVELGNEPA